MSVTRLAKIRTDYHVEQLASPDRFNVQWEMNIDQAKNSANKIYFYKL